MLIKKKSFILTVTMVAFNLGLPIQLSAFHAPEKIQGIQKMKTDKIEPLQLTKIDVKNLKERIGSNTPEDIKKLAESIFNSNNVSQALSSIHSLSAIPNSNHSSFATVKKELSDNLGFRHIRITQKYNDIPVIGAEIIVHLNSNDDIYMINGKYQPNLNIDTIPSIAASKALDIGMKELSGNTQLKVVQKPELVIYNGKLSWFYIIEHSGEIPGKWHYYIDAQTGKKLNAYNNIQFDSEATVHGNRLSGEDGHIVYIKGWEDTGTYYLANVNNLWAIYDEDNNYNLISSTTSNWGNSDQTAISAAYNFETTQKYVATILHRNSFDNNGGFAKAVIHVGSNYVNAYWDGSAFYFGDGDGYYSAPLTVLDVAAHEYGHAITQYTSNLVYQNESGALNEAYSDIIGTAVEFWKQNDGRGAYPHRYAGKSDWLMGEDCWLSDDALRDMRDPKRYGQPSYYHGTNWYNGTDDNGGVHTNSGVANFAFYLLAEGGSGSNDGHSYHITGIGITKAAQVALRANYVYHTSTATYEDARNDWIQAAKDLGINPNTVSAVWTACGIKGKDTSSYFIIPTQNGKHVIINL